MDSNMQLLNAPIPVLDLAPQTEELWPELTETIERVIRGGRYILGPEVAAFEEEVAAYLGGKHAVACNSGTDALILALRALGIGSGDEVITTSFTFFATAEAIVSVGAEPRFVDIDPSTFNIDSDQIESAVNRRTKAILPVHLFGHAADMDAIGEIARRHSLHVIEDAAQAFGGMFRGRRLGSIGDAAAFSFFPSKNLGAFGDGGLVATSNDDLADQARRLRTHGARRKYENEMFGYNSRLDELQAAVLRVKLPHVDRWNETRRQVASRYVELLSGLPWLQLPEAKSYASHVFHQFTVRITGRDREEVIAQLDDAGVKTMVYYPRPIHRLRVFDGTSSCFPHAEQAAKEVLSLPIGPSLTDESVQYICEAIQML